MGKIKFGVWPLSEAQLLDEESLLTVANGYVGMRGNFEEGYKEGYHSIVGTYVNGFYDAISHAQETFGQAIDVQQMVNVIDVQTIHLWIDGDQFSLFEGHVLDYERWLDMSQGFTLRKVLWQSPKGHKIEIEIKRMASFEKHELITIDYKLRSINYSGPIEFVSQVNGHVYNYVNLENVTETAGQSQHLRVTEVREENNVVIMQGKTLGSGLSMSTAVGYNQVMAHKVIDESVQSTYSTTIKKGKSLHFIQYAVFTDSRHHGHSSAVAVAYVREAMEHGIEQWYKAQKDYLNRFWRFSKLEIYGNQPLENAFNYSVYQLLSSAGKDGYSSISAKGLTGEGHGGHYFWDTEIYMMPFFTLTNPDIAKELLEYRYKTLESSRIRAKELGHSHGAKIAWRTINGRESTSSYYADIGHYHVNAGVAYSFSQYWHITGDLNFMEACGAEVIIETARLWLDIGNYDHKGRYVINGVTGPNVYSTMINNNYYTNAMAKWHLTEVGLLIKSLEAHDANACAAMLKRLHIKTKDLKAMAHAAKSIYLPYSQVLGVDLEDDSFEQKAAWDFANTPPSHFPLSKHYHPLTLSRFKVLRQADTVLAHLLLDDRPLDVMRKSYEYYEPYTTHDSSLSYCVYGMMASRVGKKEKAYDYLMKSIYMDLDHRRRDTKEGLHMANAGGAYMSLVYGYCGLRYKGDSLSIRPTIPSEWQGYGFTIRLQGQAIKVHVNQKHVTISSHAPVDLTIDDHKYTIDGELKLALTS